MKKSPIIAAAIAATIAGSAFAADTSMYGKMRLELINQADLNMDSHKLVIGYKASEDMGNGMTGFMRLELEHDDANQKGSGWDNDLSYVGVKGGFGSVSLGVQNDAAGFACSGTDLFTLNGGNACGVGAINGQLNDSFIYVGSAGDLTFVLAHTFDGDDNGPALPGDHNILAAKYAAGDLSVGIQVTMPDEDLSDEDLMVIGGTYMIGEVKLGFTFADSGADDDSTAMALGVTSPLAGGTIMAAVDTGDALDQGGAGDGTAINVEFNKNLSKSVYWGGSFTTVDDDANWDDDQIAGWLGMNF